MYGIISSIYFQVNELRIELSDFDQVSAVSTYSAFAVGSEAEGYSLKLLGHYSGDAGYNHQLLMSIQ